MNPVQSLALAVAGVSLFAPATLHDTSSQARMEQPAAQQEDAGSTAGTVSAADLLAEVRDCTPVSHGNHRSDLGARATIPVCGTRDVVFREADMDIDCDGQPGVRRNTRTDPHFSAATAFTQSDGRPLKSETLPFVVVPAPSVLWDHRAHGVRGGSVVAVVYRDRVQYAVVGDTGPAGILGEASCATAEARSVSIPTRGAAAPPPVSPTSCSGTAG
ncbi:hypothetical protein ACVW19_000817 [Streptomyces sp. TE5632]